MDFSYGDGIPLKAGGFLGGLTEADIVAIIGGLKVENIEPHDRDLDDGYDTDHIESKTSSNKTSSSKKHKKEKSLIVEDSSDSSEDSMESDDEIIEKQKDTVGELNKKMQEITGGGNVLQILVSLIPTVFPKSYL